MGVKDLWKLLEPTGLPVKIESLQGAILGIGTAWATVWLCWVAEFSGTWQVDSSYQLPV